MPKIQNSPLRSTKRADDGELEALRREVTRLSADDGELEALRREVTRLARENDRQRKRLEFLVQLITVLRRAIDSGARSRMVQDHQALGIAWLCRVLGIDHKRLYRWRRDGDGPADNRAQAEEQLTDRIVRIHADSGGTYGASRITVALRREGAVVNHKRVARIMRERGIQGVTRRRRRSLTRSDGKVPPAPDLLHRDFTAPRPATRLVGDITCAPTREGWVYLVVLLDLRTRQVVGWAMATRQNAALVITVLRTAFQTGHLDNDAIVHTDKGTQYTCAAYRRELARIGARQSLSRSGSCLDDAPAESFFASLKTEIGRLLWDTQRTAMDDINRWIGQFYNSRRLHSPIGYYTPAEIRAKFHAA